MASRFVKETKEFPSKKHDYYKQIQQAKAEFYIKSENTDWSTIQKKYTSMIGKATRNKKVRLERAYQLLKQYYEGYDKIGKSAREVQIGHPVQKKAHNQERMKQMRILKGLGKKAKRKVNRGQAKLDLKKLAIQAKKTRLKNAKIYQNPSGKPFSVVERKVPYEPRGSLNFSQQKQKAKEEMRKEYKLQYRKSKAKANTLERKKRGYKQGAEGRKQRVKKYATAKPKPRTYPKKAKKTDPKIKRKYKTRV